MACLCCVQADHRFRDNVDTLDQLGFQLEGMPSPPPRGSTEAAAEEAVVVSRALTDLTRVAPFLEAAVDGELRHERGRHFVADYRRLLDDPEHGFYWVLCQLHRLRAATVRTPATPSTPANLAQGSGGTVHSNAIRHYRDYVALRDFGYLLDSYRHQLWNPRVRRTRLTSHHV